MSELVHRTQPTERPDGTAQSPPRSIQRLVCLSITADGASTARVGDLAPADPVATARSVLDAERVTECFVLATCNRVEVYGSGRTPADAEAVLEAVRSSLDVDALDGRVHVGTAVAEHLSRVAAGLESPILGEDEIIGQLRRAVEAADEAGTIDGIVGRAATSAIRAGRRCRTETAIAEGELDYGRAALDVLENGVEVPDRIAVVGAGEVIESFVDAVGDRWPDARIDVANRTPDRARPLAGPEGTVVSLDAIPSILEAADAVVAATGADEPVVTAEDCEALEPGTTIVDLGNPADVDPALGSHHALEVWSLEDVKRRASATVAGRERAVPDAERLIDEHLDRFVRRERENRAEDTLRALHRHAAAVREAELERARNRLRDGDADPETILEEFASSFAGRLLAPPTDRLREAAREDEPDVIACAADLFDLPEATTDATDEPKGGDDSCRR